jgi:hypothetical protein
MQLDDLGLGRRFLKVGACHFQYVVAQLSPSLSFRKDRLPQRPRHLAAFFRLAHLENQFHAAIIMKKMVPIGTPTQAFF